MRPTVLVACDSEDRSPVAFARSVAGVLDARVLLVYVRASGALAGVEADDGRAPAFSSLRVELAASPAAGLQRLIAAEQPVLTVLGSAHDAPLGRVRLGTTAERVLHGAPGPVAVVPRGLGARALHTIAVGLLPSPDALHALRMAVPVARAAAASLLVLTVLRRSPTPADAAAFAALVAPSFSLSGPPARILRSAIVCAARPAEAEPLVLIGDAADSLLRMSSRAGLLVLGSRGYGPPGVVMPGGAARRVLAGARCPVLVVPRAPVPALVPA
jgi:nucleotide-binding universal stress UspA family protein